MSGESQHLVRCYGTRIANAIQQICGWILENAIDIEGLFRTKGDDRAVEALRQRFDSGESVDLSVYKRGDGPHIVATLLKNYYRQLPEPLFPFELYDDMIAAQKSPAVRRLDTIRAVLSRLNTSSLVALHHLVKFLRQVASRSATNCMPAANLAIVFAPQLLRPREESIVQIVNDAPHVNAVVQTILEEPRVLPTPPGDEPVWRVRTAVETSPPAGRVRRLDNEAPPSPTLTSSDLQYVSRIISGSVSFLWDSSSVLTPELDQVMNQSKLQVYMDDCARQRARLTQTFGAVSPTIPVMRSAGELVPSVSTHSVSSGAQSTIEVEGAAFLRKAQENLKRERAAQGRPQELARMNLTQLKVEKSSIKRELRAYDAQFLAAHGSEPTKHDKEPMRPLYQRYKDVKQLLSAAMHQKPSAPAAPMPATQPVARSQESSGSVKSDTQGDGPTGSALYAQLKAEKRALQVKLTEFQKEFVRTHGRKVKYREDRLPMEDEYQRYKTIKARMAELEDSKAI